MSEPLLVLNEVTKRFGGFQALDGVSLSLDAGEVIGLVGPNGSGKTTLVNVISGVYQPTHGEVRLDGTNVSGLASHKVSAAGINRTFQIPRPFFDLTVVENLSVAAHRSRNKSVDTKRLLQITNLVGFEDRLARSLTAAQQKRLDLARALATDPKVLLVDELGAGLNPAELDEVVVMLSSLVNEGLTLLIVEHLLGFLEKLTNRVVVLDSGKEIFAGSLKDAVSNPLVVEVFLGA